MRPLLAHSNIGGGGSGREAETGMDVAKRGDGSPSRNGKDTGQRNAFRIVGREIGKGRPYSSPHPCYVKNRPYYSMGGLPT